MDETGKYLEIFRTDIFLSFHVINVVSFIKPFFNNLFLSSYVRASLFKELLHYLAAINL
jgi:hypothetical protein